MGIPLHDPVPPLSEQTLDNSDPAQKVRSFPTTPGVYLMKDGGGNVIYVGKAKNLRSRASSYWHAEAAKDVRIRDWIGLVKDIDYISTPDDIAETAFFLASPGARHITAQTLHVNGGASTTR